MHTPPPPHCCRYESNYREVIATKLAASSPAPWTAGRNLKFAKLLQYGLSQYIKRALGVCSGLISGLTQVLYKVRPVRGLTSFIRRVWPVCEILSVCLHSHGKAVSWRLHCWFASMRADLGKVGCVLKDRRCTVVSGSRHCTPNAQCVFPVA